MLVIYIVSSLALPVIKMHMNSETKKSSVQPDTHTKQDTAFF